MASHSKASQSVLSAAVPFTWSSAGGGCSTCGTWGTESATFSSLCRPGCLGLSSSGMASSSGGWRRFCTSGVQVRRGGVTTMSGGGGSGAAAVCGRGSKAGWCGCNC